jgi:predicted fused transcriptional regulator/phosphomethylpyrimidine kinase/predicted transcriptional regulator
VVYKLISYEKTQEEIADLLNVSQARVSQLKRIKLENITRKELDLPQLTLLQSQLHDYVEKTSSEIVKQLLSGKKAPETIPAICQSCRELRMGNALCTLHILDYKELGEFIGDKKNCDLCLKWKTVPQPHPYSIDSLEKRVDVLKTLEETTELLLQKLTFSDFIPQIGAQFCIISSKSDRSDHIRDIAGFPGRIIRYKNQAKIVSRPEFYASSHTANLLIQIRERYHNIHAVLSIKNPENDDFENTLSNKNFQVIKTEKGDQLGFISQIPNILPTHTEKIALLDKGDMGFESITYLFVKYVKTIVDIFD